MIAGVRRTKYAVWYPNSGIHGCPFGRKQAEMIQLLAIRAGIDARIARSEDGKRWSW